MTETIAAGLQIRSLVTDDGHLKLSLTEVPTRSPGPDEVVVRVEASPVNPSDLGLLLAGADVSRIEPGWVGAEGGLPTLTVPLSPGVFAAMEARRGQSMAVGNEAGGTVFAAGSSDAAQAMLGKTVTLLGGSMYSQYRTLNVAQCYAMPERVTAEQSASCFVNPMTALSMVESVRSDEHPALVHTAAASNLGQMLNRICLADGVKLVNIVRRPEQAELLKSQGAEFVIDSSSETFRSDLTDALVATGATVAFDATGGGTLASQILSCMEAAANTRASEYSRYGSSVYKQVNIYGALDRSPTVLNRSFGFSWSVNGWLLTPYLQKIGGARTEQLRQRVASEITTTFASHYDKTISLRETLDPANIEQYARQATGNKFLIAPWK